MDFCAQCSVMILGKDFNDFAGLITREQELEGYGVKVVCSNCGPIFVDSKGARIKFADDEEDLEKHTVPESTDLREKK